MAGICRIPETAWLEGSEPEKHGYALVILVEHPRVPEDVPMAANWCRDAATEAADLRATEIAVNLALHVRQMGFPARADLPGHRKLDAPRLAVLAGLGVRDGERVLNPYLQDRFSLAIVSMDYEVPVDEPLAASALGKAGGFRYWWGINGAKMGGERKRRAARTSDLIPWRRSNGSTARRR